MYQRILVATDGSELSEKAVQHAIDMAALCNAELIALSVVPHYPQGYFDGGIAMQADDIARVEANWTSKAHATVDEVKKKGEAKGVKTRGVTVQSDVVADTIISGIAKYECDLVIMASHGRRGIKRLLLGSETQHVLTHATVPVLVLR